MLNLRVSTFLALKNVSRRPFLFLLVASIIAVGFLNAVFFNSFLTGMGDTMNNQLITKHYGNVVIEPKENEIYINEAGALMDKIRKLPNVNAVSRRYKLGASLLTENKGRVVSGWLFQAIDPQEEQKVTNIQDFIIKGTYISNKEDEIMIGTHISGGDEQGFMPQDETLESTVGDKVHVSYENGIEHTYTIKGIIDTRDFYAVMSSYITLAEAENILGIKDKASMIVIRTKKGKEKVVTSTLKKLGIQEKIRTWKDKSTTTNIILKIFDFLKNIFTIIGLLVVFVTVYLVIHINLTHRRKQIGILKAIGIDETRLIMSYIILSLMYTVGGIIIGSVLLWIITFLITHNPVDTPMGFVVPITTQQNYVLAISTLLIAATIGGGIAASQYVKRNIISLIWS